MAFGGLEERGKRGLLFAFYNGDQPFRFFVPA